MKLKRLIFCLLMFAISATAQVKIQPTRAQQTAERSLRFGRRTGGRAIVQEGTSRYPWTSNRR
jgi:hypothetical protein